MLAFFNEVCGGSTELQQFFLHELKAWFLGMQSSIRIESSYLLPFNQSFLSFKFQNNSGKS